MDVNDVIINLSRAPRRLIDDGYVYKLVRPDVVKKAVELLNEQPQIVRCKDCENYEHWYGNKGRCFLWQENGIGVFDDGFCNYGNIVSAQISHRGKYESKV